MNGAGQGVQDPAGQVIAGVRQQLLAPVDAIVGNAEMLRDDVSGAGHDAFIDDMGRICTAARSLYDLANQGLNDEAARSLVREADFDGAQRRLRHDLRNPLNAIKGYGEMLLEDLEDLEGTGLTPDLSKLLRDVDELLARLDGIVDFSMLTAGGAGPEGEAAAVDAGRIAPMPSMRPTAKAAKSETEPGRILAVDDIEANRDLLFRRLSRDGHEVAIASNGIEALAMLREKAFDLVLLDLMMPDMNGFEVLEQMKADERLRDVPAIMISALTEMDSIVRCIEAGAEDYLAKPFDPVLLRARINASLEKKQWRDREHQYLNQLEAEKSKNEKLLLSILPRQVVDRLNGGEKLIADRFGEVSVLFFDLVGFTQFSAETPPADLVEYLNWLFSHFDILASELGVEKVKTIGDSYMVVAGMPQPRTDHAEAAVHMALGMMTALAKVNGEIELSLRARIGIHSGPVVAGIIGTHRFVYDVWGDTVNVASRLEGSSLADRIHISEQTSMLLPAKFLREPRGAIELKGKGAMQTFFLNSVQ